MGNKARSKWRLRSEDPRPRVHKETENKDQAQDQTYKLQLLEKKSCKFDELFTILLGGFNLKAIETKMKLPSLSFEILRLILIFRYLNLKAGSTSIFQIFEKIAMLCDINMAILTSYMSSAKFNKLKKKNSKLWELINLILILILMFIFFVNTGPGFPLTPNRLQRTSTVSDIRL